YQSDPERAFDQNTAAYKAFISMSTVGQRGHCCPGPDAPCSPPDAPSSLCSQPADSKPRRLPSSLTVPLALYPRLPVEFLPKPAQKRGDTSSKPRRREIYACSDCREDNDGSTLLFYDSETLNIPHSLCHSSKSDDTSPPQSFTHHHFLGPSAAMCQRMSYV
ncbi:hypothetical protein KUCAC02_010208, partial [Chaenocephalus aceratus]